MRLKRLLAKSLLIAILIAGIGIAYEGVQFLGNGGGSLWQSLMPQLYYNLAYPITNTVLTPQASQTVSQVAPSVVTVYGVKQVAQSTSLQKLYLPLFNISVMVPQDTAPQTTQITAGSGFFVSSNGYILTNKHVVSDLSSTYSVQLNSGTKLTASVVYRDPAKDLALLKIPGGNYPVLPLGDSSKLQVGQQIISLGNAYGQYANTVSTGSVSALNKSIIASNDGTPQRINNVIQTDSQLYPGDSGGPTFDLSGKVVGINVATAVTESNVSFSIPINDAKPIIQNIVRPG